MTLATSACCFAPQQEATRGPSTQVQTLKAQLGLWKDRRDCDCAAGYRGMNVSTDRESYRTRVKMEMLGGVDAYVNILSSYVS